MKCLSFGSTLAILLAYGILAICSLSAVAQDAAAATYKAKRARCPGPDGKGGKMDERLGLCGSAGVVGRRTLRGDQQGQTSERCLLMKVKLKDAEIKDLVAYVRSLGKK